MNQSKVKTSVGLNKFLKGKKYILDIGVGPNGSAWWNDIDKDAQIIGIDVNFFPKINNNNIKIFKFDSMNLSNLKFYSRASLFNEGKFKTQRVDWIKKFDLIVANHVIEHVISPKKLVKGINRVIKKNGIVYLGFPEATNFTDIFYHLIHSEGGGHIQKLTKNDVIDLFKENNFNLSSCRIWPDDWLWFEKLFDYKSRGIEFIDSNEISYLANVFRKELTPEKGYFYGWEMVFKK